MVGWSFHHNAIFAIKWYSNNGMGQNLHQYNIWCGQECQNTCDNMHNVLEAFQSA